MDFDIQNDVTIDEFRLENECITMAATYYKYADLAREAKTLVSEKQDNLKVVLAESNISIREEYSQKGQKLTEGTVSALIDSCEQVITARKELREAEATYLRLSAAVSAMEIKKSELDNMVKLRCNTSYIENMVKPTQDMDKVSSEYQSKMNFQNMTPLPKR